VDSEYLQWGLKSHGITFVTDSKNADILIINTCAFILSAREEAIDAILEAVRLKESGRCQRIYVTGCLPQKYKEELQKELPEVDGFYDQIDFNEIVALMAKEFGLSGRIVPGRDLITPGHYAYLKIAEGCDNRCTYCTIPSIKGRFASRQEDSLVEEAERLSQSGVQELILIAQDITYYGKDADGDVKLSGLITRLSGIDDIEWIRLLYAHPAHMDDDLIYAIRDNEKVCRYIDIPVQHVSDRILKRMGRGTTGQHIRDLIEKMRSTIPGLAIRTTLMVGFPGETEADFYELQQFVSDTRFERLGVFKYSNEDDTPAATLQGQLDESVKEDRYQQLMQIQRTISYEENVKLVGEEVRVLIDGYEEEENSFSGRTEWDAPQIDNRVLIHENVDTGRFYDVRIIDADEYDLIGEREGTNIHSRMEA
jgi:ribosomal protein S12 methylthiotransferase